MYQSLCCCRAADLMYWNATTKSGNARVLLDTMSLVVHKKRLLLHLVLVSMVGRQPKRSMNGEVDLCNRVQSGKGLEITDFFLLSSPFWKNTGTFSNS